MIRLLQARLISTGLLFCISMLAKASGEAAQGHTQEAHVHGTAELTIIVVDTELEIELRSPAANILGFEHSPSTAEQSEQIKSAKSVFEKYQNLVKFKGSECKVAGRDVSIPYEHEPEQNDDHSHHEGHGEHDDHSAHSDVTVIYKFNCGSGAPDRIDVDIFDYFPGIEELRVQWINNSEQGAEQLSRHKRRINLR